MDREAWPKYWSFSFSISHSNEYSGLITFSLDWLDLAVQGTLKNLIQHHSSKASILRRSAFFTVRLSHPHMTTGKTIALTKRTFVGKVMSLLFNMLSRLVMEIWKTQHWPQDWKRSVFISIPKKGKAKECSNYCTTALISHVSKVMLEILQARLQQYMNRELPGVQAGFRKGRGTRGQIVNIRWILKKASSVQVSRSVVSDSMRPHESQHARPPCPSPSPGVHSDSCPSSR